MLLGVGGPFERELDGFQPREVQQEMASVVATTLQRQEVLVCEAGTGTGKTFAYLVPVLTSGLKTIISTATKTLQDQLFHRDLPIVSRALGADCDIALVEGPPELRVPVPPGTRRGQRRSRAAPAAAVGGHAALGREQ